MNRGIYGGLSSNVWQHYRPDVYAVAGPTGGENDDPDFDQQNPAYQRGRYILDDGMIRGWVQLSLVGNFQPNQGTWLITLPVPARRPHDTLPIVIGTAMVYWSFTDPNKNVAGVAILADTAWRTATGRQVDNPDNYFQIQCPYMLRHETGTTVGGAPTVASPTVDFFGAAGGTPRGGDLSFSLTSSTYAGAANPFPFYASLNGTSVQFTAQANTSLTFGWALKARIDALYARTVGQGTDVTVPTSIPAMGTVHPFDMAELTAISPFGNVFVSFRYAPAE